MSVAGSWMSWPGRLLPSVAKDHASSVRQSDQCLPYWTDVGYVGGRSGRVLHCSYSSPGHFSAKTGFSVGSNHGSIPSVSPDVFIVGPLAHTPLKRSSLGFRVDPSRKWPPIFGRQVCYRARSVRYSVCNRPITPASKQRSLQAAGASRPVASRRSVTQHPSEPQWHPSSAPCSGQVPPPPPLRPADSAQRRRQRRSIRSAWRRRAAAARSDSGQWDARPWGPAPRGHREVRPNSAPSRAVQCVSPAPTHTMKPDEQKDERYVRGSGSVCC